MSIEGRTDRAVLSAEPEPLDVGVLVRLDAALLDLRRFTEPKDRPAFVSAEDGRRVEMSTVLVVHAVASSSRGRCDIGGVAAVLHVAHSTASRLVDRASAAGMVTRDRDVDDPRRTVLALTEAGEGLNAESVRFRTRHLHAVLAQWSAKDVSTLTTLLERFAADSGHPQQLKELS